jgi:protein ImuB
LPHAGAERSISCACCASAWRRSRCRRRSKRSGWKPRNRNSSRRKIAALLHDTRAGGEEWLQLVERLQSRLGSEAVHGVDTHPDHRPERAWVPVSPGKEFFPKNEHQKGPRPLWLLDPPRRLAEGEFCLLAGPERIESAGGTVPMRSAITSSRAPAKPRWRGSTARAARGQARSWFLHGFFA